LFAQEDVGEGLLDVLEVESHAIALLQHLVHDVTFQGDDRFVVLLL
jgi:hypothetical protein